ncbi:MAG: GSCFA domain-containing protein, partial [Rikenellaceae bacterium]|nr:GSCFA domain-containing protein [Rikenellaceae bacterium]
MQFRTPITISPSSLRLDHSHRVVMFGSCFSEHIAERMRNAGFHVASNPFGIMFNPASIARNIERLSSAQPYTAEDLTLSGERWVSFDFHGDFASRSADEAIASMNRVVESGAKALREADTVVLTLGTAWVYRHNGQIVANCHKLPAQMFTRQMMSVEEIVELLTQTIENHLRYKQVVLTVSPVRHVADGLDGNSLSKAVLRVAAACVAERLERVCYFPSFEIMNDDLRDYRFYEADMVHPSAMAVDYIWERWCEWAISPSAGESMREAERLWRAAHHRP